MDVLTREIDEIVRRVLQEMESPGSNGAAGRVTPQKRGVFSSVEEAMQAVTLAQRRYQRESMAKRKAIIRAIRDIGIESAQKMAQMVVAESHKGRVADKVLKHLLVSEKTPGVEILPSDAFVGDDGLMIEESAPFGTILSITPVTNPTATIINNAISMLAAGNTVFFAPHPGALQSALTMIDLVNEAIQAAGGPANLLVALDYSDIDTVNQLMTHPKIELLCVTGGRAVVGVALRSGKRA
nr:aldehyde dehydrogenase family protein [Anaerolineae bacterium]